MSREYADRRIAEALKIAGGNPTRARQQLIAWTYEDAKLLHALVQPHLAGIVAYAIGRVLNKGDGEGDEADLPLPPPADDKPSSNSFGFQILKSIIGADTPRFGQESNAPPVKKQPASQRHIDSIRQMIAGAAKKTKK